MDAASLVVAGIAAGAPIVATMVGFFMKIDRRLTRLESAVRHRLELDIDLSDRVPL